MKRVVIVHGWEGRPEGEWRPWLKKKLLEKGYKVDIPGMPNTLHPKMKDWVKFLKKTVGTPNKDTVLLGHSLGAITILRYLENLREGQKVGAVILMAGFSYDLEYEGYNGEVSTFFQTPVNFEEVKKHCDKFVIVHSEEDKWVPVKHAYLFKEKLGAETIVQKGMGHYSGNDGIVETPIILDIIEKL